MKALIIFGSTTGNTEEMAGIIRRTLAESGLETELKNVVSAKVEDLTDGYDLVLLGCPAYGDDTVELQEDFKEFYEKMDGLKLNGLKFAVFAPGDSSYEHFCGAVDLLQDKMTSLGGKLIADGLKVDGDYGHYREEIIEWAKNVAAG